MRILFACGGSGGHINPALGIANSIKQEHKDAEFLFAGNPTGMEADLIPKAGYAFAPIKVYGFPRKLTINNIKRNVVAAACLLTAGSTAKKIISGFKPDVVVGTGGYVSGPVLMTAAKMGYKTLAHESNAYPGLTTKLLAKQVDKVLLTVEAAKKHLPEGVEYVVTGTPIRQELLTFDKQETRKKLGVGDRICLLSFGGSLGATPINEAVADVIAHFKGKNSLHQIHATGKLDWPDFSDMLKARGIEKIDDPHIDVREYIYNMPECIAAADVVICRSGAVTLMELQCTGKASILIPSPYLAENHQYHNAMVVANKDAAIVIEEKDLTGEKLCRILENLIENPQDIERLGKNAGLMAITDPNQRICKEIYSLAK